MRGEYNKKQIVDCGRIRNWMLDAAAGSIPDARRAQFESHLRGCAACAQEFQRVRVLLQSIDEELSATLSVEPSPALLANIRQAVASQTHPQLHSWGRRKWLVAGACAAFAIVFAAIVLHKANRASPANGAQPIVASLASRSAEPARPTPPAIQSALNPPRHNRALLVARRTSPQIHHRARGSQVPEVIVEPGQLQAVMQFVADVRTGKINGAEIQKGMQEAQKALNIEPLQITPLDASASDTNEPPANSREPGSTNGRSQ